MRLDCERKERCEEVSFLELLTELANFSPFRAFFDLPLIRTDFHDITVVGFFFSAIQVWRSVASRFARRKPR